ncbi:unnamed protein product [Arabis nemorensis]|uniref:Uncharacterized protein n=1 Tax=Arabis nemorensis TaxID=586526 RepID=A0A565C371_9BRAS|nr:unnamed protein product [Arabis nemorensis]
MALLPAPWISSLRSPSSPNLKGVSTRFDWLRVALTPVSICSSMSPTNMTFSMMASAMSKPLAPSPNCSACSDLGMSRVQIVRPPDPSVPPNPLDLQATVIPVTSPSPFGSSPPYASGSSLCSAVPLFAIS